MLYWVTDISLVNFRFINSQFFSCLQLRAKYLALKACLNASQVIIRASLDSDLYLERDRYIVHSIIYHHLSTSSSNIKVAHFTLSCSSYCKCRSNFSICSNQYLAMLGSSLDFPLNIGGHCRQYYSSTLSKCLAGSPLVAQVRRFSMTLSIWSNHPFGIVGSVSRSLLLMLLLSIRLQWRLSPSSTSSILWLVMGVLFLYRLVVTI